MKILESRNMTVGEATVKVYKTLESLGYEFDLEEQKELKEYVLEHIDRDGGSGIVKNIFTFVFDNYNDLKNLIN
ncbi:hypothetical protein [Terrisporobacter mayombei]|uniref:Uncharacterized protein n=1 Tax=Terrisporobacter mayombei TaxID=1541 RepID=A0ABY9Q4K3_9FIRM|nr:hypothetical protein [Terrisporobacter mayombei]MCC3868928.1 hypothetical protein [Terrisporobacter mayombei]WMT82938.1 hypothetical protein TEMA_34360 [Terrisporobacter mayombei]